MTQSEHGSPNRNRLINIAMLGLLAGGIVLYNSIDSPYKRIDSDDISVTDFQTNSAEQSATFITLVSKTTDVQTEKIPERLASQADDLTAEVQSKNLEFNRTLGSIACSPAGGNAEQYMYECTAATMPTPSPSP